MCVTVYVWVSESVWIWWLHDCSVFPVCRAPRPAWRSTWSSCWGQWSPTRSPRAAWSASSSRSCPPKWYGPPSCSMCCDRTKGVMCIHPMAMLWLLAFCLLRSNTPTITPSSKTQSIWGSLLKRFRSVFTHSLLILDQGYGLTKVQYIVYTCLFLDG